MGLKLIWPQFKNVVLKLARFKRLIKIIIIMSMSVFVGICLLHPVTFG